MKVTSDKEVQKIEVSESDEHKKETTFEWDLDIVEKPTFENKSEKIETTSRWHPEFLKQLKPIEIPEIQTPKTVQKLTPKTEKELLEGIIEVIEIIDLTNR